MAKFMVHTSIGLVGCERHDEIEIPDAELAGLTRDRVEKLVYAYAQEVAEERLDYYVTVGSDQDWGEGVEKSLNDFELIPASTEGDS